MKSAVSSHPLASVLSFGANAAVNQVNAEQAQNLRHGHRFRFSGSAPMDMRQELAAKAEKEGASSYRIIEARTGDNWHATAGCTNKPSSSYPTTCPPRPWGLFINCRTLKRGSLPAPLPPHQRQINRRNAGADYRK